MRQIVLVGCECRRTHPLVVAAPRVLTGRWTSANSGWNVDAQLVQVSGRAAAEPAWTSWSSTSALNCSSVASASAAELCTN
eukprot:COSAG02_NODE_438_length_22319_cov_17.198425_5_plen_81_part_00